MEPENDVAATTQDLLIHYQEDGTPTFAIFSSSR